RGVEPRRSGLQRVLGSPWAARTHAATLVLLSTSGRWPRLGAPCRARREAGGAGAYCGRLRRRRRLSLREPRRLPPRIGTARLARPYRCLQQLALGRGRLLDQQRLPEGALALRSGAVALRPRADAGARDVRGSLGRPRRAGRRAEGPLTRT